MAREPVQAASRYVNALDGLVARPARPEDVEEISLLSAPFVDDGLLIARPLVELAEKMHEFVVARQEGRLVGCMGMAPTDTPTDKSLVVYNLCIAPDWQGRGIGRHLVGVAVNIGRREGYQSLLALTRYGGEWFRKLGFSNVPVSEARDEWRTLFRPDRRSSLYRLILTSEQSRD
ncbi:GNAT family N-acetyltransferase [Streptomyces sp. NBC_00576]|uniref:GNAT family N-acetyltransferase n=1 Tax=Streptomyces sp. NBC_00576 TaxID=2903665 RepID=UPI002E7FD9FA|nr:GNAT family N-acetyltransferase [Streptomyces sp. NBC_00576]WUB68663.1 GNAT family N-acetyltransferase [Streptomyces sp. NBC_00576]WUB77034.1 GNAT family N-acetyltransferase [Streptomyces sp. NBC_00576]